MRLGQDLVTTKGAVHLAWEICNQGLSLYLTRADSPIFEEDDAIDRDADGARDHAHLMRRQIGDLRAWLAAFAVDVVAAMQRISPMLHGGWPYVALGDGAPAPAAGDVQISTAIQDQGPHSDISLTWAISAWSLAASIDIGPRLRKHAIWRRHVAWGPGSASPSSREGVTNHQTAIRALVDDLGAWVDSFRLDALGVAERLGQTILRATGRGE